MTTVEQPVVIECMGVQLLGILHKPSAPRSRAVLIVVGGPQYRVGSHRQFLLLARYLSERGTPVLRFDYRGMGDSQGEAISFEDTAPDICAAVDTLFDNFPELSDVVIWGLCDAASAAMMYAYQDARVSGLVLANPWARTEAGIAKTYLQRYYKSRILDRSFWKKLLTGKVDIRKRISEFLLSVRHASRINPKCLPRKTREAARNALDNGAYIDRMRLGLIRFSGSVLIIMSGDDLTAAEFDVCVTASRQWRKLFLRPAVQRRDFAAANHTFSRQEWRDQVAAWTDDWLKSW